MRAELQTLFAAALSVFLARPDAGFAQGADSPDTYRPVTLGARADMGMAHAFYGRDSTEIRPRFAGGGGAYVDFRPAPAFAIDLGVDLIGKGYMPDDGAYRVRLLFLEIPLGVKLFSERFAVGLALGADVGLYNQKKPVGDGPHDDVYVRTNEWGEYSRFNLSPRATIGYAIPAGRLAIVPGLAWSIELLDEARGGLAGGGYHDWSLHEMNLMATIGLELGAGAAREAPARTGRFDRLAIGGRLALGAAYGLVRGPEAAELFDEGDERSARFSGGGAVYLDVHLLRTFALEAGLGFVRKGHFSTMAGNESRLSIATMEVPLGARLDFYGVQLGLTLALHVALSAYSELDPGDSEEPTDRHSWGDAQWGRFRRVNFGPHLSLGYAIPIGRAALVPGVEWSTDLLDNATSSEDGGYELRNTNIMFNLAVEYGFGG
jgi:hypothetical protein